MRPPFILVPDALSNDTVDCCRQLLNAARRGELIGLAFCGMLRSRGYLVNTAGEAHRNPTFARGMLRALDDQLGGRIRGGSS